MSRLISFHVVFRCLRPLVLVAWSGSVASAYVRSVVKSFGEVRMLAVSPLFTNSANNKVELVLSGLIDSKPRILREGTLVSFQFTITTQPQDEKRLGGIIPDITNTLNEELSKHGFAVKQLDVYITDLEALKPRRVEGHSSSQYILTLEFFPTIFVFRGWRVLYPSPSRLIFSLARSLSQLFPVDVARVKKRANALIKYIEILGQSLRIIDLNIGKGRAVKAFLGRTMYGVYGRDNLVDVLALVKLGELINVGKSRGIGFGHIKLIEVKQAGQELS